jgi:dihydroxyacetone kinase
MFKTIFEIKCYFRKGESLEQKVKIISGCRGSIWPLFSGYVGRGMLTAAVIGYKLIFIYN